MRRLISIICVVMILSLTSTACKKQGSHASMPPPEPGSEEESKSETYRVEIINFSFSPQTLEIPIAAMVTWVNQDDSLHIVTSNDGTFSSDKLAKGGAFSHTFEKEGIYEYHCTPHSYMKGKIVVKEGM